MFAVLVQVFVTPAAPHDVHGEHGVIPDVENVDPVTHATWHLLSDVLVQAVLTPNAHAVHDEHGAAPEAENVEPVTHAAGADVVNEADVTALGTVPPLS